MFHADHWAAAFVNALGENAEAGLGCLQALVPPVKAIPGALFGRTEAKRLELMLQESVNAAGCSGRETEYAIRFITMLVEKNLFRHIGLVLVKIEKKLDRQKGVLDVCAELAESADSVYEEELRQLIKKNTGAAEIKMETRLCPELLGGYRLWIEGLCIDASLRGQLEQMSSDLAAVPIEQGASALGAPAVPGRGA